MIMLNLDIRQLDHIQKVPHVSPFPPQSPFAHLPQQDLLGNAAVELLHLYLESQKRVLDIPNPRFGLSSKHSRTERLEFSSVWRCCGWQTVVYFRKVLIAFSRLSVK